MRRQLFVSLLTAVVATIIVPVALADGTETLGPPSVTVASGTHVVTAGVGTHGAGLADGAEAISVSIPAGATVNQVLLYWEGHATLFADQHCLGALDPEVWVNGTPVTGTLIGGPTNFFGAEYFAAYRKDITSMNLVSSGANTLTISKMHFQSCFPYVTATDGNDGVGVVVIYDDGSDAQVVGVRDGLDLAFHAFNAPLDTTVAQTFSFTASAADRTASLATMAASVSGPDLAGLRGNVLRISFDVGASFDLVDPWQSSQGDEFDALNSAITVPAGASTMTVQALSAGGSTPGSFAWIGAGLTITNPPSGGGGGGEGCTPGYWKNHDGSKKQGNAWAATPYTPTQLLSSVFSPAALGTGLGSVTLRAALDFGGGSTLLAKKQLLVHHAVAALLNAAHPDVSYPMTTAQIISAVNAALASNNETTILALKDQLDTQNNAGCPLGNNK